MALEQATVKFEEAQRRYIDKSKYSAEQVQKLEEAEKQKERQAKLAGYRKVMSTILSRRKEGHKDEMQMKITAQVLLSNPDIHTLWNIRRECVLAMLELNQSQDKAEEDGDKEDNDDDVLGVPRGDTTEGEAVVGGNVKDENITLLVGLILSVVVSASNVVELVMVSSGTGSSSS